ncbi:MAG: alpha/beta hydrolase [Saprospiraceae bacterium]
MKSHKLKVQKTAHYYTLGEATPNTKYFWIVCHGYGQLAASFIQSFRSIASPDNFILAPEGLSHFYWKNFRDLAVASWMTSQNRVDEIEDYTNYLKSLYDQYRQDLPQDVKIILMGFSQGCATQCRWIMKELPDFEYLMLWGGLLPEDLQYKQQQAYFASKKILSVYGRQDPLLTLERQQWQKNFALAQGLQVENHIFNGKHEIDRSFLKEMDQFIRVAET